jgi:signal transduction histidine kinase
MPLFNMFASFTRGRSSAAAPKPRLQTSGEQAFHGYGFATPELLSNLTLADYLLLPAAIFAASILSIEFAHASRFLGGLWASNAIVVAALLRHVRTLGNYGSIFLGGLAAMTLAGTIKGNSLALSGILTLANAAEIGSAVALLWLCRINALNLASFRNLLIFVAIAGGLAPFASTIICATAIGPASGVSWISMWRNWYVGHALAMIIVVPFLVSVTSRQWGMLRLRERLPEVAAIFALFFAIGVGTVYFRPTAFVVGPAILIATVRFGLIGATATTLVSALVATSFVVLGIGQPFLPLPELSSQILSLQAFLTITSFWALPTAGLLAERDRLLGDLSRANARLLTETEKKSHLVIGLRRHLSMVEENERLRLSHELHDQAGQSLIAAVLELNEIDALISGPARGRLHLVRKNMEEMGKTLHRIAWELRPPSIDELGLRKALASYIADWGERCGTDVDFHCEDTGLDEVPDEIGTTVYRVVQEGLTNIVKHAQRPSSVSVVIRRADMTLQVIIEDNGCGFDVGTAGAKLGAHRGLGLDGMRERLSLIGGTLEIESAINAGTTIFARILLDGQRPPA